MLPLITGLLGTFVGLILGNRLALGRDKRREFNETASPIFEILEKQKIAAKSGSFPNSANAFSENSIIQLKQHISSNEGKGLDSSMEEYEAAKQDCGNFNSGGYYEFSNPQVLIDAIENLQQYVRRK